MLKACPSKCMAQVINVKITQQGENSPQNQQPKHQGGFKISSILTKFSFFLCLLLHLTTHLSGG